VTDEVLFERRDGVAWITLNRPAVKNALTTAMCEDLAAIIAGLRRDDATRVVVLRGNGPDFTAGADLKGMATALSPLPGQRGTEVAQLARRTAWPIFLGLHELHQPIVASVRGHVIGAGAQFILSADLTVASETTRFLLPQVRLGHSVDHGESYYLPRKLGIGRVMQMLLLAETLSGADLERIGLANWVVPDEELEKRTEDVVARLAGSPWVAVREMKSLLRGSLDRSIEEQFAAEVRSLETCAASEDFLEAINAFVEKRKPVFRGR
jgi:2-(1,2-epoxy-1,2-dihydrophenyl)acetyl-CoA isomerase